jgi:Ca2+-binding EF-hand superfamily protein
MLSKLKLAIVAASVLVAGVAIASPDGKKADRGERRAKRMAKFDLNKDGKLDAAERKAMFKVRFDKADKNGDGVLSLEEAETLMKRGFKGKGDRSKQP